MHIIFVCMLLGCACTAFHGKSREPWYRAPGCPVLGGSIRIDHPGLHYLSQRTADPSRCRSVDVLQIDLERISK